MKMAGHVVSRKNVARNQRKNVKKHKPDVHVIDMKDHVMGRAAAVIAKQLVLGRKITCVRTDKIVIAGTEIRNKIKYLNFLKKRKLSNPTKGPFHHRAPSDVFARVVRGMLPRGRKGNGKLGTAALHRLTCYEGIPVNVNRIGQRVVIPRAQRRHCHRQERAFTVLGNMCQHIGWKYKGIVDKLEAQRIAKATRFHEKKQVVRSAWAVARKEAAKKINKNNAAVLAKFGVL